MNVSYENIENFVNTIPTINACVSLHDLHATTNYNVIIAHIFVYEIIILTVIIELYVVTKCNVYIVRLFLFSYSLKYKFKSQGSKLT